MPKRRALATSAVTLTLGCVLLLIAGDACMDPTQVTLDVRYRGGPCREVTNVLVMVGSDPRAVERRINENNFYPTALTQTCEGGQVGTLVLTPSDTSDHAAIVVIAGLGVSAETCKASNGYLNCIVARRQLNFIRNKPLVLPVVLERTCANVPCNETSSCKDGRCASSEALCIDAECKDFGAAIVPDAPTRPPNAGALCAPTNKELTCGESVCSHDQLCCSAPSSATTQGVHARNAQAPIDLGAPDAMTVEPDGATPFDATAADASTSDDGATSSTSSSGEQQPGSSSSSGGTTSSTSSSGEPQPSSSSSSGSSGAPSGPTCGAACSPGVACFGRANCTEATPSCCLANPDTAPATTCQATCALYACRENCDCPDGFVCEAAEIGPHLHKCVRL